MSYKRLRTPGLKSAQENKIYQVLEQTFHLEIEAEILQTNPRSLENDHWLRSDSSNLLLSNTVKEDGNLKNVE